MADDFAEQHRQRYGFVMPEKRLIVETAAVEAVGASDEAPADHAAAGASQAQSEPVARVEAHMAGQAQDTPVYEREALPVDASIDGPAIISEAVATTVVEPGWRATMTERGDLVLERVVAAERDAAIGTEVDPVMLEVFNNLYMSIAEQMGVTLQNTAYSVNIKERLDFSCAIFDPGGNLVANAPHMPVHLGSMSESIRAVIRNNEGRMAPGDVFVLNAPYNGGTHLPDVTVITPVFDENDEILFTSAVAATMPISVAFPRAPCRRIREPSMTRVC